MGLTWDEMIEALLELFQDEDVNIEAVEAVLSQYNSSAKDWKKFAKYDKYKYTRNLVHEGNGKFNLMLLCWAEGNQSAIHDHADAHCFVKVLDGGLREVSAFIQWHALCIIHIYGVGTCKYKYLILRLCEVILHFSH